MSSRSFAVLSVTLAACSLLGHKGASAPGSTTNSPSPASGPTAGAVAPVTAASSDSSHVRRAVEKLDEMEQLIAKKAWTSYIRVSSEFQHDSVVEHSYAKEPKGAALQQRADALDALAYKTIGGRLLANVGDGKRVIAGVDPDAIAAAGEMLDACDAANAAADRTNDPTEGMAKLQAATATYEKLIARVAKLDPKAFHYMGELGKRRGYGDVPNLMLACEAKLGASASDFAETYAPEVAATKASIEIGCGEIDWLADGVRTGPNQFAPYRRTEGGNSFVEKVACSQIPRKDAYPASLAVAVKEFREHIDNKQMVIVLDGASYTEVNNDDLHIYRYQKLRAYSKTFALSANACGEKAVFCEVGGSRMAGAYNQLEFALDRAAADAGSKPDVCKNHLKNARAAVAYLNEMHADLVKTKKWVANATYRTKKGVKLGEKDFLAAIDAKAKIVDDEADSHYCASPAK